ncbi:hypothetical protein HU200_024744 [Digitaria exilis]|uniref:Uncharacterized protein n=1 Tax=Digitaria exilis TaxID=1010633 RepID=A0A835EY86_9POAL|nr:hypothetical protein HU200_024744 [Digitaria exilis]CAB3461684.1 unnamed protein product [Digitaria exilis]
MDSKKKRARVEEKATVRPVPPASSGGEADAGATPPSVRKAPLLPDPVASPADDEPVDLGVGDVEEDDDDEKVERFYALLANIRAMRGLVPPCVASTTTSPSGGDARKRLRAAEAPWRPAFRMEDFEVVVEPAAAAAPAPAPPSKRERMTRDASAGAEDDDRGESTRPAVVAAPSPSSLPHAAARCDSDVGL